MSDTPRTDQIVNDCEHLPRTANSLVWQLCRQLERETIELKADLAEKQALFDLQHKRTMEADKLWQIAHNQPNVWPDLGKLIEWLMKRADERRCCFNCKHGPKCGYGATVCIDCAFAMNNPADGKMKWEEKKP